jgi:hypothetical protein
MDAASPMVISLAMHLRIKVSLSRRAAKAGNSSVIPPRTVSRSQLTYVPDMTRGSGLCGLHCGFYGLVCPLLRRTHVERIDLQEIHR